MLKAENGERECVGVGVCEEREKLKRKAEMLKR
jgi:hypothetical protein